MQKISLLKLRNYPSHTPRCLQTETSNHISQKRLLVSFKKVHKYFDKNLCICTPWRLWIKLILHSSVYHNTLFLNFSKHHLILLIALSSKAFNVSIFLQNRLHSLLILFVRNFRKLFKPLFQVISSLFLIQLLCISTYRSL